MNREAEYAEAKLLLRRFRQGVRWLIDVARERARRTAARHWAIDPYEPSLPRELRNRTEELRILVRDSRRFRHVADVLARVENLVEEYNRKEQSDLRHHQSEQRYLLHFEYVVSPEVLEIQCAVDNSLRAWRDELDRRAG